MCLSAVRTSQVYGGVSTDNGVARGQIGNISQEAFFFGIGSQMSF